MARPKNDIPRFISFDMQEMDAIQSTMTNEELGSWWRKAIRDVRSGCRSNDVDDFIKEQYQVAESRMQKRQQTNQAYYNKHNDQVTVPSASVNANGSQQEAANGNAAEDSTSAKTSGSKVDAPVGNAGENYRSPQGSRLESATSTAVAKPLKKPYGENKHVLLTDEEGAKLRELYGHDLAVAINILDGYIENNGKAAKRYKSHYMVLRRGNWVWDKVQNMKLTEKRLENAGGKAKNFKAEEREAMARFIRGESVNHDSKVNDSELSMEELKQLYG